MHCTIVQSTFLRQAMWASPTNWRRDAVRLIQREIRRRSDLQLLILCKNWSNSIYWNAGFSNFSQRDRTQTIFLSLYSVKSYQDKNIVMNIILNQGSPQVRCGNVGACEHTNVMYEALSKHSFWRCSWKCTHLSKFWQAPIELWRGKPMYRHSANFYLALLHLWQNRGQQPRHPNLPVQQSQNICIQEDNFWNEWTWFRYLCISHEAISPGDSRWVPTLWVASESCVPFCLETQTSVLN